MVVGFILVEELDNVGMPISNLWLLLVCTLIILSPAIIVTTILVDVVCFYELENIHFVHKFLFPTSINTLDNNILDALLLSALVDNRLLASANLLINVVVVHFIQN